MPAAYQLTTRVLAAAGILIASIGVVLAYTGAFPDVQCSGDVCMMTSNVFTIPAVLIGAGLGIASIIRFLRQRFVDPLAAKH